MQHHLYLFAGFPRSGLNAGGIQHACEEVESLALLEHDPAVEVRTEGVFLLGDHGEERIGGMKVILSPTLPAMGITMDWFTENWSFGNGCTVHHTYAAPDIRTVVHGTDASLERYLDAHGPTALAYLLLERKHIRTEGWAQYERRWAPGTCPQEKHVLNLTWLIAKHAMADWAYGRLWDLIEGEAPIAWERYTPERHRSPVRAWNGQAIHHHSGV